MFLDMTQQRNPRLIEVSLKLHQQGAISPNTYVLDLDAVILNASLLAEEAKKQDIELYFMTKQFGRNPVVAKAIVEAGIKKAVAVDPWEALTLSRNGIKLGHVGHLVQVPQRMIPTILNLNPDYVTVFGYENAKHVSDASLRLGRKQKIFLRIANEGDFIYNGQEGGFTLQQILEEIHKLESLPGIIISGLTSFPCVLIQGDCPTTTPNVQSMQKVKNLLEQRGHENLQMNMPSATSVATMNLLKDNGATQGEPGHALTGTTPLHATKELAEIPAMTYVSEISHFYNSRAYVFGGGFYPRSHMNSALIGSTVNNLKKVSIIENDPTNIDYYGTLNTANVNIGDTAIFAFRTQIFVTNAHIAIVKNISSNPELLGIYDANGNAVD
ncbi:amino-acid racemase [Heyndrickxia sporothermodurans]|nr:amino-acid racemase [Heyndrickxia sporothermodurans]